MALDKQRLNTALSTLHEDEKGYFASSQFLELNTGLRLKVAKGTKEFNDLVGYLDYIHWDIWSMETIALRLAWQKRLWAQGRLGNERWMLFAACDIEHFHIKFRSLFDHLANAIRKISNRPGQVTNKGFEKLRNSLDPKKLGVEKHRQAVGEDLAQFVLSCEWFGDLKEVRESVVHHGGFTLVFPEKGRLLFQVYKGWAKKVRMPEIMFNTNVVDFELYAGLYIGYLIAYLEEFAELVRRRVDLEWVGTIGKSYHSGLRVVHDWLEQLLYY